MSRRRRSEPPAAYRVRMWTIGPWSWRGSAGPTSVGTCSRTGCAGSEGASSATSALTERCSASRGSDAAQRLGHDVDVAPQRAVEHVVDVESDALGVGGTGVALDLPRAGHARANLQDDLGEVAVTAQLVRDDAGVDRPRSSHLAGRSQLGSSSRLVLRRNRPIRVIRGSSSSLNTPRTAPRCLVREQDGCEPVLRVDAHRAELQALERSASPADALLVEHDRSTRGEPDRDGAQQEHG